MHSASLLLGHKEKESKWHLTSDPPPGNLQPQNLIYVLRWGHDYCQHHQRYPAQADQGKKAQCRASVILPIVFKSLMEMLAYVFRTRVLQASRGSTMWQTPSSRDLDWRLSSRSLITWCVFFCKHVRMLLFVFISSSDLTSFVSTGPHWLCELFGVEWKWRVSNQTSYP